MDHNDRSSNLLGLPSSSSIRTPNNINAATLLSTIRHRQQTAIQQQAHQQQMNQNQNNHRKPIVHIAASLPPKLPAISFKTGRPIKNTTSKGTSSQSALAPTTTSSDKWYYMRSTPMTPELQMDINLIQNRNYMDPKRFYKSSKIDTSKSGFVQVGTVIEGSNEYYSNRYTNKERPKSLLHEVMNDPQLHSYTTSKYQQMQQSQTRKSKQKHTVNKKKYQSAKPVFSKKKTNR